MKRLIPIIASLFTLLFSLGCGADKDFIAKLPAITSFDAARYMGTWYEVARFQHSFEKDLMKVTATYTLLPDGSIEVINAGYLISDPSKRKETKGKAHIAEGPLGYLKVSFFRPFYGDYRIIVLDEKDYQYVLIVSSTKDYLWILSRTGKIDKAILDRLIQTAANTGLDMSRLFMVPQN